jgi:hypothetical protein
MMLGKEDKYLAYEKTHGNGTICLLRPVGGVDFYIV